MGLSGAILALFGYPGLRKVFSGPPAKIARSDSERWRRGSVRDFGTLLPGLLGHNVITAENTKATSGATERSDSERWRRGPERDFGTLLPGPFRVAGASESPFRTAGENRTQRHERWRRVPVRDFGTLLPGLLGCQDTS